jgi:DNA repair ATPase RecN
MEKNFSKIEQNNKEKKYDIKEIIREVAGFFRSEIKLIAKIIVQKLPKELKQPIIGRFIGWLAQRVEKSDLMGMQEVLSDAIEILADTINKTEDSENKEEIYEIKKIKQIFEKSLQRLEQAENVESEKAKIISQLKAYEEVLNVFREIIKKYEIKEENLDKIENILNILNNLIQQIQTKKENLYKIIKQFLKEKYPKIKEETKKSLEDFLEGFKEGWEEGGKKSIL